MRAFPGSPREPALSLSVPYEGVVGSQLSSGQIENPLGSGCVGACSESPASRTVFSHPPPSPQPSAMVFSCCSQS